MMSSLVSGLKLQTVHTSTGSSLRLPQLIHTAVAISGPAQREVPDGRASADHLIVVTEKSRVTSDRRRIRPLLDVIDQPVRCLQPLTLARSLPI
jgi:hypothetical protein